jgi:subfamily B ATP-binding cassette protein MsbA
MQKLSLSFYERSRVGHLMSRMTNDVLLIQNSAGKVIDVITGPLTIVGGTVYIFWVNWRLAAVSLIVLPLMAYAIMIIGRGMRKLTDNLQGTLADIAAVFQETISGVRVVKSFGMEDYEVARFDAENQQSYRAAMSGVRRSAAMSPTAELISVGGITLVLLYGGHLGVPGYKLLKFVYLLYLIGDAFRTLGGISVVYHQAMSGARRIFDVLDEEPEIQDAPNAKAIASIDGRVEFRNVSFYYNRSNPVLRNISFTVEPGQQVALVGPSGAGKSTIANLIPRFYDAAEGSVLVDGYDVRALTMQSLRRQIGIVPQETMLFGCSLKENIAYGSIGASEAEIVEAAKAANAHDFIERLPEKYDTLVGERGVRLSGGERQRVAIARAILKNPKLLILDEATSSLDVSSEAIVQEALERLMRNRTTLVIAHRLSTIVNADRIIVMEDGRIAEFGRHEELLRHGGVYADLYAVQSKGGTPGIAEGSRA